MNKSQRNKELGFVRKGFVSNNITERLLEEIMDIRGCLSRSQIIRDAIFEYRKATKGLYLSTTPLQEEKYKKLTDKQRFEEMSDEDYAKEVLLAPVFQNSSGTKFVVMHWFGNTIQAQPLDGCKKWFSDGRMDIVENHLTVSGTNPIDQEIKKPANISLLKAQYGIIIGDNEAVSDK